MVYTTYNISFNFRFPWKLCTLELTHVAFPTCTRYSDTKGVIGHFDFMRKRTLCIYNLEKLFAAQRIRLEKYAVTPNVS